jgi:hypothetical protein
VGRGTGGKRYGQHKGQDITVWAMAVQSLRIPERQGQLSTAVLSALANNSARLCWHRHDEQRAKAAALGGRGWSVAVYTDDRRTVSRSALSPGWPAGARCRV